MGTKQIISPYDFFADEYPGVDDATRQELAACGCSLSNSATKFLATTAVILAFKSIPNVPGSAGITLTPVAEVLIRGDKFSWDVSGFLQGNSTAEAIAHSLASATAAFLIGKGVASYMGAMTITLGPQLILRAGEGRSQESDS